MRSWTGVRACSFRRTTRPPWAPLWGGFSRAPHYADLTVPQRRAEAEFTTARMADQYEEIYRRLLR
jgi:hypothetical protein